jgi:hypothetical protein
MTQAQLAENTGKTILSTARQIIGTKYPDPETEFVSIEKNHIRAVIGNFFNLFYLYRIFLKLEYAWLMHPLERKSNNEGKIRHAMGNVFATRKFLRKLKAAPQPSKSSTLTTTTTTTGATNTHEI